MPRGKKSKKCSHSVRHNLPKVAVFGHSMPRNLSRYLDTLVQARDQNDTVFCQGSLGQKYATVLGVDKLFSQVQFFHCATVSSPLFKERIEQIAAFGPALLILNISSNDLAQRKVVEKDIANHLVEKMHYLVRSHHVESVIFLSELKRCDTPNKRGRGRLQCSPEVFRSRVMKYNEYIQGICKKFLAFHFQWLQGFWWDAGKQEIPVSVWSSDRLHPGPNFYSSGFQRYYWAIRNTLLKKFHSVSFLKNV